MPKRRILPSIKRSYLWAIMFAGVIGVWLASGMIAGSKKAPPKQSAPDKLFRVEAHVFSARERRARVIVRGRTEAFRRVEARAQTKGIVQSVARNQGTRVKKDDLLCTLELAARATRLAEARARLAQARLDLDVAKGLAKQKFVARTRQAAEQAKFDAARAGVARMEKEIEYTRIKAPVSGIIDQRPVEPGSFLQVGHLCATISVLNPLRVIGNASEREVGFLRQGMAGTARLITGGRVQGKLNFVSPRADKETRTFRIELEVPNPKFRFRDGLTAEILIDLPATRAHLVTPAILTLDDSGRIGVRVLDKQSRVRFKQVKILADGKDGVWIGGLDDKVTIITLGHEYVTEGQKVAAVIKPEAIPK
jgi:multidrug efflux system membrane fusion protein